MPDEPVTVKGHSLTVECDDGKGRNQELELHGGSKGPEYHHRHAGTITSVDVDGQPVPGSKGAKVIVIHYDVP